MIFGELLRITVVAGVNLPYPKTPVEWFMEDMIPPISLLTHLFGDMRFLDARQDLAVIFRPNAMPACVG